MPTHDHPLRMNRPPEPLQLRPFWAQRLPHPLALAGLLFLVLTAFRGYGYFASDLFQSPPVTVGFILMWFVPSVFLTHWGRRQIGLVAPRSLIWLLLALLGGAAAAGLCYGLGIALYGKTEQNWFVSVGYTYLSDERLADMPRNLAFIAFTVPALIASPIGEEFFFRGFVQESARDRLRPAAAACLAAALFAGAYLIHHGIYRSHSGIEVMPVSGALWFALMFATSLVFSFFRRKGGSIWTAVAAHAAFNLVMNATIFYSLMVNTPRGAL